jgi:CheY-like chemotaxis protein
MPQGESNTFPAEQDARRCPRQRVSWLVTVADGPRRLQGRTKDISASGAKILLKERPPLGTQVALRFRPPGRRPIETRAIVWRLDGEGLACMFVGTQEPEFLEAVTPARRASAASARPAAPPPPAATATATGTVLLAATDAGIRGRAVDVLGRNGYKVLDAGPQPLLALRLAEQHGGSIDLVLVDAGLRLMNDEPLVKRLTQLLPLARAVLISSGAATGPTDPGAVWLSALCTDAELVARVRHALAG